MPHLEPTYLRYIYDGLNKGSIHPENSAELPDGLIGMYEEAFEERKSVIERQKLLQRFAIWALLKKEVSAAFVAEVVGESEDDIQEFISTYSAWFNSPESGKYQLYHERLKVYLLQKLSDFEIKYLNRLIIDKVLYKEGNEFEIYKVEFLVFHLLTNDDFSKAYDFLIDYQTYLVADKHFQSDIFLQFQLDLCIRKFAQLEKESEVLKLIRIQYRQLDVSLNKVITNPLVLFDAISLIDTIEVSKRLNLKQRISFWQDVLIKLIQNLDDLINVNEVLKRFDNSVESFQIIDRNSNHQFKFDAISRKNFFLLINYLLDNNIEVNWLINRFDWLPDYSLSRDAILDDEEYFSDFKMIQGNNKEKILEHFKESLKIKTFSDLYRSETWCLKFILRLAELNIQNQTRKILFNEINNSIVFNQTKEQVLYCYAQKYKLSFLPFGISDENWKNKINDGIDGHACLKLLLKELDSELIVNNENLKCLFLDCLYEICSITEGEFADYTIQDELLEEMILLFLVIYTNVGIDKFIRAIDFFSLNFQISLWNEYVGETGPLNLNETIYETVLPFILKYDNRENNVASLLKSQTVKKCEIILCFCDIYKESTFEVKNIPKFILSELTNYFHDEPECLFHIIACLKIDINLVYQNLIYENKLNFKSAVLFVYQSFLTQDILEKIEVQTCDDLNSENITFLEPLLQKVLIHLINSDLTSKKLLSQLLDTMINSKRYYDITDLLNICNNKSFIYMKFRNDFKYANQLIS